MDINEIEALANNGDTKAMVDVGNYYFQLNTGHDISIAAEWYEKAAEQGSALGILHSMLAHAILAAAAEGVGAWELAYEDWDKVYDHADKFLDICNQLRATNDVSSEENTAYSCRDDALYGVMKCFWHNKEYDNVTDIEISDKDSAKIHVLYGLCLWREGKYREAIPHLQAVESDEYINTVKNDHDYMIYSESAFLLSGVYRIGSTGLIPSDINKAKELLTSAYYHINNPVAKEIIAEELNKYQKKLFGGYKYIG